MKNYFDFNQSDWHNIEKDWLAWWNHSLTRPLIMTDAINYEQYNPEGFSQFVTRFSIDTPVDEVLDYFEERFRATYCYGDGYPKWFPQLGPGVLASFLGSRPDYNPISDTTWFHPLEEIESLKDIQITPNEGNIWWKRVQDITNRAVERWRENFIIGHTDIGGIWIS